MEENIGDICGLCGKSGADKMHHPCHWPTEREPKTKYVHSECEKHECEKAYFEFRRKVGDDEIKEFLKSIR